MLIDMLCGGFTGCEEADNDDDFASEADTMLDILYEGTLMKSSF